MYPHESVEHHREHYHRIRELYQYYHDPISKYRGNSNDRIRHNPIWAGSLSRDHRHRFSFGTCAFKTLVILNVYPGVTVYHSLMVFFTINAKDLIMQHEKFHSYILKLSTIFWHCKKIWLLLNKDVLIYQLVLELGLLLDFALVLVFVSISSLNFVCSHIIMGRVVKKVYINLE